MKYVVLVLLTLMVGCSTKDELQTAVSKNINESLKKNLSIVAQYKIYFGHMSVGENILAGIEDISKHYTDINLHIINLHKTDVLPLSYFAHSYVGDNHFPGTKCRDFIQMIDQVLTPGLEYAFLKFCFVDIDRDSDVEQIFTLYKNTIDSILVKHPEVKIVHFTVPLIAHHVNWYIGLKRFIKKIINRRDYSPLDNIKRYEYNQLLRDYYKDEPIFDIARFESTYPDDQREYFIFDNKKYPALIFDYSDDAGHLNEIGRQLIAIDLIKYLAQLQRLQTAKT